MNPNWTLDHIGHAVFDLESSVEKYRKHFGFEVSLRESLEKQAVDVAFLELPNTQIELISPLEGNVSLKKFLGSRGEALHHMCFEVDDIVSELERLSSEGLTLVDSVPRSGAHQSQIAFIHPASCNGALIELCQKIPR